MESFLLSMLLLSQPFLGTSMVEDPVISPSEDVIWEDAVVQDNVHYVDLEEDIENDIENEDFFPSSEKPLQIDYEYAQKKRIAREKQYHSLNRGTYRYSPNETILRYDNFIDLGLHYKKDKYYVYYDETVIPGASIYSFEVLNSLYSKDKNSVFYKTDPIEGAHVLTFKTSPMSELALDKDWVYYKGKRQEEIDKATFKFISSRKAQDKSYTYTEKNGALVQTKRIATALPTPEKVKGIYMSGYNFYRSSQRQKYIDFVQETELNTLVIDIKGSEGHFMFSPQSSLLQHWPLSKFSLDYDEYKNALAELQNLGIYTIARVTTFQDPSAVRAFPHLALKDNNGNVWENFQGVSWLDMTLEESWDLPIEQAKEAFRVGFDEVQFDYIRFPSDGYISRIKYGNLTDDKEKYEILSDFFARINSELEQYQQPISIDLFGLTYRDYTNPEYALGIGQRLIDAAKYFDYISPMIYPSHYGPGHFGLKSPVHSPYELLDASLEDGHQILLREGVPVSFSRPWLQDFDLGAQYDAQKVRAQIRAADKNNTSGWLLWNARNVYTSEALYPSGFVENY